MSKAGLWHGADFLPQKNGNLDSKFESTAVKRRTVTSKLLSLRKRLGKVEQQVADRARREEEFAHCICGSATVAVPGQEEEFEAKMNVPCPSHGFRKLGRIIKVVFVNPDRTEKDSSRLDQLLAI
jgi:hypothetical protein